MKINSPDFVSSLARALDIGALIIAFTAAAWLAAGDTRNMPFQEVLALRIKLQNFLLFVGVVGTWSIILAGVGLYQNHIYRGRWSEIREITLAIVCCAVALWIAHELFRIQLIGP